MSRLRTTRTPTILPMKPTSRNAKQITCGTRFGVRVLFAFSGMNNEDAVPCATRELPGSQVGAFTTTSPVSWGVRPMPRTAFYFIRSAMTGFIVSVWPYRHRVSLWEAFEGLEPDEGKLSRPVLRGPGSRKAAWLLGTTGNWRHEDFHLARFTVLSTAPSAVFPPHSPPTIFCLCSNDS